MAFMKRLSGVVQAKANKVLDRVEDPRETLDLSYEKQLEQLQQVRKGVADVATARKRIELQASQLQASANKLQAQAKQALSQNREDLAREALSRRAGIADQLEQLQAQEEKLVTTTQQLQTRVEAFRSQKETLKASYTAAEAQTKIGEAVSGISESMSDTGMAMQRAQDKIANMQARAGAVDELLASGALTDLTGSSDPLQAELDKSSQSTQVELELAQLKGQLAPAGDAPAIAAASGDGAETTDAEVVSDAEPAPAGGADLFTLNKDGGA
jgi:phage shock protein A